MPDEQIENVQLNIKISRELKRKVDIILAKMQSTIVAELPPVIEAWVAKKEAELNATDK